MSLLMKPIYVLARSVKLVILDVDGVLTDGSLFYNNQGEEYKAFNSKDGHGIRMLQEGGIDVAFLTGRKSELLMHRAKNLNIPSKLIYQGYRDKRPAFKALLKDTGLSSEQVAFIGDDVIDLPVMSQVGMAIAVNDAHAFVRQHAHWVTEEKGGRGAVREASEMILDAQGKLESMLSSYLEH